MKKSRTDIAQEILDNPKHYKICLVCGAIIPKGDEICPECYAYRFNLDEAAIAEHVIEVAGRPQRAVAHEGLYED